MKTSKKLVFFGNERLATGVTTTAPTLRALVKAGYDIEAVIANHQDPVSRQKRNLEIGPIAHEFDIPVILPGRDIPLVQKLKNHPAEAAVLVAFGKVIPQSVIDMFPMGIINIHPSLLPKYRGPTPIESAILGGDKNTGVSLMKLVAKMDAGPVYAQQELTINGNESKQELADKLLQIGGELSLKHLPAILDGSLKPIPQPHAEATYTKLITKTDGLIDLSKSAEQLQREVRAYAGWPKSRTIVFGQDIVVTKTRIAKDRSDGSLVLAANPGYIEIQELTAPSGKTMSGSDFLRGYAKN